jgi:hypothetical protein
MEEWNIKGAQIVATNGEEQLCKERSLGIWEHFRNLERTLVLNAKTLSPKERET